MGFTKKIPLRLCVKIYRDCFNRSHDLADGFNPAGSVDKTLNYCITDSSTSPATTFAAASTAAASAASALSSAAAAC